MKKAYKSIKELEAEAAHLSNFGGDEMVTNNNFSAFDGEEDFSGYTGSGDPFMEFAGGPADSFADAVENKRVFKITLVNANAATRTAYLFGGYAAPTGLIATGAFNDKNGDAGLTGSSSPGTIAHFLEYIDRNPTLILGMKVKSTLASQLDESLTLQDLSPFITLPSREIYLSAYVDEKNYNDKIATVTESFYASNQTQVQIPVVGSSTVTITLYCGPSLNTYKALQNKTEKAKYNIFRSGGPGAVKRMNAIRGRGQAPMVNQIKRLG
jgi:hypothetical protein